MDPEKERARLADVYANMPLEQLQEIASDPMSLTEIAQNEIQAELRRRGVVDTVSEETSVEQSDRLVVLCRYRDLHEALMAQGTLESAGIESFLADENMVRMHWMWSNALGGVRLFVWQEDASDGRRPPRSTDS